jgi:hypothetical protein
MLGLLRLTKHEVVLGLVQIIGWLNVAKEGLGKWFGEKWVDVKTGKPCGRSGKEKSERSYPACRPKAAAQKMTAAEKQSIASKKKGPERESWPVTPTGKRKEKK